MRSQSDSTTICLVTSVCATDADYGSRCCGILTDALGPVSLLESWGRVVLEQISGVYRRQS